MAARCRVLGHLRQARILDQQPPPSRSARRLRHGRTRTGGCPRVRRGHPDVPVEVRLLRREEVQIPVARFRRRVSSSGSMERPEVRGQPVGGRSPPGPRPGRNQKPVAFGRARARGERGLEPRVPIRRRGWGRCRRWSGYHLAGLRDQRLRLGQRRRTPDRWPVVGTHVVPAVGQPARVPRVNQNGIDAKGLQATATSSGTPAGHRCRHRRRRRSSADRLIDDRAAPPRFATTGLVRGCAWRGG